MILAMPSVDLSWVATRADLDKLFGYTTITAQPETFRVVVPLAMRILEISYDDVAAAANERWADLGISAIMLERWAKGVGTPSTATHFMICAALHGMCSDTV